MDLVDASTGDLIAIMDPNNVNTIDWSGISATGLTILAKTSPSPVSQVKFYENGVYTITESIVHYAMSTGDNAPFGASSTLATATFGTNLFVKAVPTFGGSPCQEMEIEIEIINAP